MIPAPAIAHPPKSGFAVIEPLYRPSDISDELVKLRRGQLEGE